MSGLSENELLAAAGIIVMFCSVLLGLVSALIFTLSGRKLEEKLKKDYGEPGRYNR